MTSAFGKSPFHHRRAGRKVTWSAHCANGLMGLCGPSGKDGHSAAVAPSLLLLKGLAGAEVAAAENGFGGSWQWRAVCSSLSGIDWLNGAQGLRHCGCERSALAASIAAHASGL